MSKERPDNDTRTYERTEKMLYQWGQTCRDGAKSLGISTSGGMSGMIIHAQKKEKSERVKPKRKRRVAEDRAHGEPLFTRTVNVKETPMRAVSKFGLGGEDLTVDKAVSRLPNWARKCIFRSYMWCQPDRKAAEDMKMRVGEYSRRKRAAVDQVAMHLKQLYNTAYSSRGL